MKLQTSMKHELNTLEHVMNLKPFHQPFFKLKMIKYTIDLEPFHQLFFESKITEYTMDLKLFLYSFEKQSFLNEILILEES
jgi:hypothetical protein